MISLNDFKEILTQHQVTVPDDSLEFLRDLIDAQADLILDSWYAEKIQENKKV